MPTKEHRIRRWSEQRTLPPKKVGAKDRIVQVYLWECWGPGCVKDGKPTKGAASLFRTKSDTEADTHKEN